LHLLYGQAQRSGNIFYAVEKEAVFGELRERPGLMDRNAWKPQPIVNRGGIGFYANAPTRR
jgi:hypothetical protein